MPRLVDDDRTRLQSEDHLVPGAVLPIKKIRRRDWCRVSKNTM